MHCISTLRVRRVRLLVCVIVTGSFTELVGGCTWRRADGSEPGPTQTETSTWERARMDVTSGLVRVLTYNVAGLPGFLSASRPATNHPLVSPLLNHYHLVFAQEDFAYHEELVASARHLYRMLPLPPMDTLFGDGLCGLSVFPLERAQRIRWSGCHGYLGYSSDCFGEKGFSVARARLSHHVTVDIYNVHAEAGDSEDDLQTRRRGFQQLAAYIERHSESGPIIVAGDTNLETRVEYDRATFHRFMDATNLTDACDTLGCARPSVDRVMFRGSDRLALEVQTYRADPRFVDQDGRDLSDHQAIAVELAWHDRDSLPR